MAGFSELERLITIEALWLKYKIYALHGPDDSTIRYIGYTGTSLELRLEYHIESPANPRTLDWIASLKKVGKLPSIKLLAEAKTRRAALKIERKLIQEYAGPKLLNIKDNKEGSHSKTITTWVSQDLFLALQKEALTREITISKLVNMKLVGLA